MVRVGTVGLWGMLNPGPFYCVLGKSCLQYKTQFSLIKVKAYFLVKGSGQNAAFSERPFRGRIPRACFLLRTPIPESQRHHVSPFVSGKLHQIPHFGNITSHCLNKDNLWHKN